MFAYFNGRKSNIADVGISPFDLGFTMGVTVTEQIRTYQRQLPLLDRHLDRLEGGLRLIGLAVPIERSVLRAQIEDLVSQNGQNIPAQDELGIGVCITPGLAPSFDPANQGATTLVYTYRLDRKKQSEALTRGIRLASVSTTEIPDSSVPRSLKCRSRMHYYLAEREAKSIDSDARALLCDNAGYIAEGTTASIVMVKNGRIVAPLAESVLPGVTLGYALEIADQLGIAVQRRPISLVEFESASEAMWLTTPLGIVSVSHINHRTLPFDQPDSVTKRLAAAWAERLSE